jgi:hypothetical protein
VLVGEIHKLPLLLELPLLLGYVYKCLCRPTYAYYSDKYNLDRDDFEVFMDFIDRHGFLTVSKSQVGVIHELPLPAISRISPAEMYFSGERIMHPTKSLNF